MVELKRRVLVTAGLAGTGMLLASGPAVALERPRRPAQVDERKPAQGEEEQVGAVEDLMREHGVLRRVLLVYRESAFKLHTEPAGIDGGAIARAAKLFRGFGEDYHEKKLEEAFIFPALRRFGGPTASLVDVLVAQHNRGRELTDYILAVVQKGKIGAGDAEPLARALETMALMYQNHAAREDTVLFPAWKKTLAPRQLQDLSVKFEDIEREQFGRDGFDDAVKQIAAVEQTLGFADLAQFTAPSPPRA